MRVLVAALILLATPVGPAQDDAEAPLRLEARVSFDLAGAQPNAVLHSLAALLEAELELDPAVGGAVDMRLEGVRLRTALDAICESLSCRWALHTGSPARLVIDRLPGSETTPAPGLADRARPKLDETITLELSGASAKDVFGSFAHILDMSVAADPSLQAKSVTLDLEDRPVRQVLDEVCAQVGCAWAIVDGNPPVLAFTPRLETP